MTQKQRDTVRVDTGGMLLDESAAPARDRLVTPQELPPDQGDQFDSRFALLDERERGDRTEPAKGRRRTADKPRSLEESPPKKRARPKKG